MSSTTPNLSLTLPTPNVDSGWGGTLNTDFTLIDNLFPADGSGTSVGIQVGTGKTLNAGGTIVASGTMILGGGDNTGTVTAPVIRGAAISTSTSDGAGANLTIDASNGTGTGGSGKLIFRTAPPNGGSGTTANTMASRLEINNTGAVGFGGANYGTTKQALLSNGSSAVPTWSNVDGTVLTIPSQAQGDILYRNATEWTRLPAGTNGQLLRTNGAAANPSWQSVPVQSSSQSFSGSSITFTGIPSTARIITIPIAIMGTANSVAVQLRVGTSSGIITTGYESAGSRFQKDSGSGGDGSTEISTTGFIMSLGSLIVSGSIKLINVAGTTWVSDHTFGSENNSFTVFGGGRITLPSGTLDRVQLVPLSGSFTAAGSASILYM